MSIPTLVEIAGGRFRRTVDSESEWSSSLRVIGSNRGGPPRVSVGEAAADRSIAVAGAVIPLAAMSRGMSREGQRESLEC